MELFNYTQMEAIDLADGRYALRFPYHMVTEMTVFYALPKELKQSTVKFSAESASEAGKRRMDSDVIEKNFPIECAMLRQMGKNLNEYIIISIQSSCQNLKQHTR